MDFKQQKILISCRFMSSDFGEKNHFVEQLDNASSTIKAHCQYYYIIVHKVESLNYGNYVANVRNGSRVGYGCDDGHAPMISTESVIDQSS
jgi:hypothetical protein